MVATSAATGGAAAAPAPKGESPPQAPRLLPGDAAAAGLHQNPTSWLVGARPSQRTGAIARRFDATRVLRAAPVYRVARERASAFAAALKAADLYGFSEPDYRLRRQGFPAEPALVAGAQWGLGSIGATAFTPPPVHSKSPLLAVVDNGFDSTHPEWQGANLGDARGLSYGDHQNMVASVAGAPGNGIGMAGVWPGMRLLLSGAGGDCGTAAAAVDRAVYYGAKVINMSYSLGTSRCWTHLVATNYAYAQGVVLVAAAGNDGIIGDRGTSPGEDPHVITVAALGPSDNSPPWSNANGSIDLAAPGEGVLTAVPYAFDSDGAVDGYTYADGTSFSSPMVAAAAAWVSQERPTLDNTQLTELIRGSARDLGRRGWDPVFGFGAFYLPFALTGRAPRRDYLEPNDDLEWVDGRRFQKRDAPVWPGGSATAFSGTLDQLEDPVDVYNFRMRPRSGVRISIRPSYGDPDLEAFDRTAVSVYLRRGLIARSRRPGRRIDTLWLDNSSRRSAAGYVSIYPKPGSVLSAGYRVSFQRVRLGG
jgi:subtilase family protein